MSDIVFFAGLKALVETAFPKQCSSCGKVFATEQQFLQETQKLPLGRSSLKEVIDEDGSAIVEVFRNCSCGSTLMDEFSTRRDDSERGRARRVEFSRLIDFLVTKNIPAETARYELLKVLRGEDSELINLLKPLGEVFRS